MSVLSRSRGWFLAALLIWGAPATWVWGAAPPAVSTLPKDLAEWPAGPVRWLLLEPELRAYRALQTREAAMDFIREFWRLRDSTPGDGANAFADAFSERVQMADALFTDEASRGALTDRGGALILLGSPNSIRVLRRRTPSLRDAAGRGSGRPAESPGAVLGIEIERWRYPRETVREALGDDGIPEEIELEFVRRERRVHFSSGRVWVERAARAALAGGG
jgi:GWxTD domain-containing protein